MEGQLTTADEFLTVAETAAVMKVSPKRVRNMMCTGTFRQGEHFFRRRGLGPRFLRSRVEAWVRGADDGNAPDAIPMARQSRQFALRESDAA